MRLRCFARSQRSMAFDHKASRISGKGAQTLKLFLSPGGFRSQSFEELRNEDRRLHEQASGHPFYRRRVETQHDAAAQQSRFCRLPSQLIVEISQFCGFRTLGPLASCCKLLNSLISLDLSRAPSPAVARRKAFTN